MQLNDFIVPSSCPIIDAMKKIDQNGKGIIYVCEAEKLQGVLTDGDIRRYILKNGDLNDLVSRIANKHPIVLPYKDRHKAPKVLKEKNIRSVPLVDENLFIISIAFSDGDLQLCKEKLGLPVVIMAGGKGTRLYPYTQILPKPLIPIGEKTITEHIMEHFEAYGCTHFDLIVNYKKNFIKSYFMDNEISADISFVEEKEYLGTGGGLKLLEGKYKTTFFLSNCDILVEEDYGDIVNTHKKNGNVVTMVCASKRLKIPYGIVKASKDGQVIGMEEKPELSFLTNTGLYVLEPEFLDEIPDNTFIHITDVIQKCIDKGKRVGTYSISEEHWMDMGQLDELERMRKRLVDI